MTNRAKALLLSIAAVAILVIGFLGWYRIHFSMAPAEAFSVNDASSGRRLLIATQGSAFKNAVVTGIVERLRQRPIFIQVVDVGALSGVNAGDWDAIVVLHTIEYGDAPPVAQAFVDRLADTGKIVVLSTSGRGDFRMKGIDAISSASRMTDVPARVDEIVERIDGVLTR
ncbi:MAG TPA: hypothetical protein VHH11_09500 [Gammaproteobacteria bacterium]|nr:hypothetical protein [Gammaproteobacteria bacterium]